MNHLKVVVPESRNQPGDVDLAEQSTKYRKNNEHNSLTGTIRLKRDTISLKNGGIIAVNES